MTISVAIVSGVFAISAFFMPMGHAQETLPDGPIYKWPGKPPIPKDNPSTPAKIALGKKLFFDARLSKNNKVSCNSCHNVMKAGDDGLPRSPGHEGKFGGRNSPTVLNSAYWTVQFWDGRAPSLEEQAKGPLINPVEMGMVDHNVVVDIVSTVPNYIQEFKKVFGPGKITIDKLVKAIAAYERTLITPNSPYDRYVAGDKTALSPEAKRGWSKFGQVGCTACHSGPMFNGPIHTMGQGFYQKFPLIPDPEIETKYRLTEDTGRHVETKNEADRHMWRVPSLRNVARTAPYFHTGSVPTLDEAVRVMAKTQLGKVLKPDEISDIVAFLTALNGDIPKQTAPTLPEGGPVDKTEKAAKKEARARRPSGYETARL
jgi:cytochrome c peroxidase